MSEEIDDSYVNGVYVKGDGSEEVEISGEYVYMSVGRKYVCVYDKVLVVMGEYGVDMVNDCCGSCKGNNKNIVSCWNMFECGMGGYEVGEDKVGESVVKYIKGEVNIIYEGSEEVEYSGCIRVGVDEEGKIDGIVSCGDGGKFYVEGESGKVWEKKEEGKEYNESYSVSDVDYDNK